MSGLLRRIRGARGAVPEPGAGEEPTREQTAGEQAGGDPAIAGAEPPALPAGTDLDLLVGDRPTTQRRSRLRRRLRHLRRVREYLLRDLGGMVFEIHRAGMDGRPDGPGRVVQGKLHRLAAVDAELRELREILDDRRGIVLREPGLGGTCPLCGEIHGSDARFCWACGTPVAPGAARPIVSTGQFVLGAGRDEAPSWVEPPAGSEGDAWVRAEPPAEPEDADSGAAEHVTEAEVVEPAPSDAGEAAPGGASEAAQSGAVGDAGEAAPSDAARNAAEAAPSDAARNAGEAAPSDATRNAGEVAPSGATGGGAEPTRAEPTPTDAGPPPPTPGVQPGDPLAPRRDA